MFNCDFCRKTVEPKTPCLKIITAKRMHNHPFRPKVQKKWVLDKTGKIKEEWADDRGGVGPQIVHEAKACTECHKKYS